MSTAGALGSLGSDLAFSVSFGIATELLDAANESHLSEEELIAIVLALSVVLAAMPSSFRAVRRELAKVRNTEKGTGGTSEDDTQTPSGLLEFATLLVRMAQRISISICVQLLSANVRSRQPLRAVRIVSLLAVSIFFLFLESTSGVGQNNHVR
jgi:hypothetical protein|tara:strand:+ start:3813 stop:4274 length:462 start_codon:yes stop_codon:yes gene_type:complete